MGTPEYNVRPSARVLCLFFEGTTVFVIRFSFYDSMTIRHTLPPSRAGPSPVNTQSELGSVGPVGGRPVLPGAVLVWEWNWSNRNPY